MKCHTTNYQNTFVAIADDCPVQKGVVPPAKGEAKTIANLQFELIGNHPYRYTSDEVLVLVLMERNAIDPKRFEEVKAELFSKGQACLRASPLPKKYGWGIHFDEAGKTALVGSETKEYQAFLRDGSLKILKAMKSSR
ncbi:MAG: hypothetical protein IPK50_16395 [Fibrobacterota bacterium]|nr:MAG: hypothetical protein IPK50_16395 [Fibrobacterota bacterium]